MSSSTHQNNDILPVLSLEFFERYDLLQQDAVAVKGATASWNAAKAVRDQVQQALDMAKKSLRWNRDFAKEQVDRIQLVSTHWFYGTTMLQPQLWFRGGCSGKIQRAKNKLTQAEREYPGLLHNVEDIEFNKLPPLQAAVQEHTSRLDQAEAAAKECQQMKDRAISEHPSQRLYQLVEKDIDMKEKITKVKGEEESLNGIAAGVSQALNRYKRAINLIDESIKHNEKHIRMKNHEPFQAVPHSDISSPLGHRHHHHHPRSNVYVGCSSRSENILPDGSKEIVIQRSDGTTEFFRMNPNGTISLTNRPCPNRCGYVVTWHQSHCCSKCAQNPNEHGQRCEQIREGAGWERLSLIEQKRQEHFVAIRRQEELSHEKMQRAVMEAKEASHHVTTAIARIPLAIQEKYAATCAAFHNRAAAVGPSMFSDGFATNAINCSCSKTHGDILRQILEQINQARSMTVQQEATLNQLIGHVRNERITFEGNQQTIEASIETEKDLIFTELRSQANGVAELPPPCVPATVAEAYVPTAVSQEYEAIKARASAPTE